jgi:hypothetical protein
VQQLGAHVVSLVGRSMTRTGGCLHPQQFLSPACSSSSSECL